MRNALLAAVAVFMACPLYCRAAELRVEIRWQVAPPVTDLGDRMNLPAGPAFEQIVAAVRRGSPDPAETADSSADERTAVVAGEFFPLRYRRTIHRYFELIRRQR